MSFHKNDTPELKDALRLHGLEAGEPSQLADAFRSGFRYARRTPPAQPLPTPSRIERPSDQSVTVTFSSCRLASVFERMMREGAPPAQAPEAIAVLQECVAYLDDSYNIGSGSKMHNKMHAALRAYAAAPAAPDRVPIDPVNAEQAIVAKAQAASESVDAWRGLFWSVAVVLKCLPSTFVDDNEHVIETARKWRDIVDAQQAAPQPTDDESRAAFPTDDDVERALNAKVCEGETVRSHIAWGFEGDSKIVRRIMMHEVVRVILASARTLARPVERFCDVCKGSGVVGGYRGGNGENGGGYETHDCPHCGGTGEPPTDAEIMVMRRDANAGRSLHASLCRRFGYCHDEKDWYRDLVSLEEHIAKQIARPVGAAADDIRAWEHEDGERVISASTKAVAERDGGASLSSVRAYTVPLVRVAEHAADRVAVPTAWREALSWCVDEMAYSIEHEGRFTAWASKLPELRALLAQEGA